MSNGKRFKGNGKRSKGNDKRSKGKNKKATGQAGQKNRRYGQWGSMQRMEASQGILIGRQGGRKTVAAPKLNHTEVSCV